MAWLARWLMFDLHITQGEERFLRFFTHPAMYAIRPAARRASRRLIHTVPRLVELEHFAKNGIEGLYTPGGFSTAWQDYQKYLTLNLTLNTNGTENELRTPYQILLHTAKQTTEQHTFHYASQAHNNHFFFNQLTDKSRAEKTRPSRFLLERLADINFPSAEAFRDHFLLVANKLEGQGWVFLVELPDKRLKVLACHNDGTPYYYGKNQSLDLNASVDEAALDALNAVKEQAASNQRDLTLPLLAVSVWDVAYLHDYGATGRADYLARVWECINWDVVNKRLFQV